MDFGRFFNFGSRRCKFAARRHFAHHFGKPTVFCTVLLTCCIAHFIILLSYSVIMRSVRNGSRTRALKTQALKTRVLKTRALKDTSPKGHES